MALSGFQAKLFTVRYDAEQFMEARRAESRRAWYRNWGTGYKVEWELTHAEIYERSARNQRVVARRTNPLNCSTCDAPARLTETGQGTIICRKGHETEFTQEMQDGIRASLKDASERKGG